MGTRRLLTESRNRNALAVAGINRASALEVTNLNNAAMKDYRESQVGLNRAQIEQTNLATDMKKELWNAQKAIADAPDAKSREAAEKRFYDLDPVMAGKIQETAASKVKMEGDRVTNDLAWKAAEASDRFTAASNAGNKEEAEKARRDMDTYDSLGAQRRSQAEAMSVEARGKAADAQIKENLVLARSAAMNATTEDERKAAAEMARIWEFTPRDQLTEITAYQAQAKLAETALNHVNVRLQVLRQSGLDDPVQERTLVELAKQYAGEADIAQKQAMYGLYRLNPGAKGTADPSTFYTPPAPPAGAKGKGDKPTRPGEDPVIKPPPKGSPKPGDKDDVPPPPFPSISQRINRGGPSGLINTLPSLGGP